MLKLSTNFSIYDPNFAHSFKNCTHLYREKGALVMQHSDFKMGEGSHNVVEVSQFHVKNITLQFGQTVAMM